MNWVGTQNPVWCDWIWCSSSVHWSMERTICPFKRWITSYGFKAFGPFDMLDAESTLITIKPLICLYNKFNGLAQNKVKVIKHSIALFIRPVAVISNRLNNFLSIWLCSIETNTAGRHRKIENPTLSIVNRCL